MIQMGRSALFFEQPQMHALHSSGSSNIDEDFDQKFDEASRESATFATGKCLKATFFLGILMHLQRTISEGVQQS